MLCGPGALIVLIKAKLEVLQPFNLLIGIVFRTLRADYILQDNTAIAVEFITPITVCTAAEVNQVLDGKGLMGCFGNFLDLSSGGGHGSKIFFQNSQYLVFDTAPRTVMHLLIQFDGAF